MSKKDKYLTTIELQKESMKFSAGHSTIFSATEREPLHGHTYFVYLALTTWVTDNGMTFDYRYYRKKIVSLCKSLSQTFLMPSQSPHLEYGEDEDYYYFTFNGRKMPFLKDDVTLLPVVNITVEELSRWLTEQLVQEQAELDKYHIEKIVVKVFSGPGQSGAYLWQRTAS